jgi:HPt (histidine-containing phosphotransfer) domain-containing protein
MKDVTILTSNGVNVEKSLELFGDMEMYDATLNDFLEDVDKKISNLKQYRESGDMQNYAIEVHALKSDAKYLGCMTLADIAYKYEMASKENNIGEVEAGFAGLKEETEKVVKIIKNYLGK